MKRSGYAYLLGIIIIASCAVLVTRKSPEIAQNVAPSHVQSAVAPTVKQQSDAFPTMASPKELRIPSIGIHSVIRPVGLTKDGAMAIPDNLTEAGWFDQSAIPGNPGKAVLAAHTGYPKNPSIFRNLERVAVGTRIEIGDANGETAHFEVIETARYPTESAPRDRIFGDSPTGRLNIITCSGTWDAARNAYTERLIIYAVRVQ